MFLRLRQLCLVAYSLDTVIDDLCAVLDAPVCHRDPAVQRFGLHNALLALGSGFLEVVAPLRNGTAAGRYLERRGGNGGYMVILETDQLPPWREHLGAVGVRLAADLAHGDYCGLQLHPRDTGGALLEINTTRGNSTDPMGPYAPAGPDWQGFAGRGRASGIAGAVLQSADPQRLARRWSAILQRPLTPHADGWLLPLDHGHLRFVEARDGRGEGLAGVDLADCDGPAIHAAARARGCATRTDAVCMGGIDFHTGVQA